MRNKLVKHRQYGLDRVLPLTCSIKELLFSFSRSYFKHSIFLVFFVFFERRKHLHFVLIFYLSQLKIHLLLFKRGPVGTHHVVINNLIMLFILKTDIILNKVSIMGVLFVRKRVFVTKVVLWSFLLTFRTYAWTNVFFCLCLAATDPYTFRFLNLRFLIVHWSICICMPRGNWDCIARLYLEQVLSM